MFENGKYRDHSKGNESRKQYLETDGTTALWTDALGGPVMEDILIRCFAGSIPGRDMGKVICSSVGNGYGRLLFGVTVFVLGSAGIAFVLDGLQKVTLGPWDLLNVDELIVPWMCACSNPVAESQCQGRETVVVFFLFPFLRSSTMQ